MGKGRQLSHIKLQTNVEADQTVDINDGIQPDFFTPSQLGLEESGFFIYKSAPQCLNILTHCDEDLFSVMFSFVSASSSAYVCNVYTVHILYVEVQISLNIELPHTAIE